MADFSIQDVAFTGFAVVRQHPRVLVAWWLYALIFSVTASLALVGLGGADLGRFLQLSEEGTPDPAVLMGLMVHLLPVYLTVVAIALVAQAILSAAMIRAVLRPRDDRFGYLRLGADELRQLGLLLLTALVFAAVYLGIALVVGVVAGFLVAATKAGANALLVVVFLSLAVVILFLAVRLSLAPALTFDHRRINLAGSWALTRGRFWPLFGAYLLAFALAVVVSLLGYLLIFAVCAILNGGDLSALDGGALSLKALLSPIRLVQTVLNAGVSALSWPVLFAPAAAIYRAYSPAVGDAFA
jgi:hypothetical protein